MKSFVANGTGSQQTLTDSQDNKIPVYDSVTDAEADLANLSVGQIVATKDTGDELAQPVDVVEEGNLHAVSSNAVAEKFIEKENYESFYFTKYAGTTSITIKLPAKFENVQAFMFFCQGSYTGRVSAYNFYKNNNNWSSYAFYSGLAVTYDASTLKLTVSTDDSNAIGTLAGFIIPTASKITV